MTIAPAVHGLCDACDRLIEADAPLAGLQMRCGGDLPGVLAVPSLLALVQHTRASGVAQSRTLNVVDEGKLIAFFASATPSDARPDTGPNTGTDAGSDHGTGETTRIVLSQWRLADDTVPEPGPAEALWYQMAALHAVVDSAQRVLTADVRRAESDIAADIPVLADLAAKWLADRNSVWSDAVEMVGVGYHQPLHWRLIDDVAFRLPGSARVWRARLLPRLKSPLMPQGDAGFDLLVLPDALMEIPGGLEISWAGPPMPEAALAPAWSRLIGRDLAPALRQPINRIIANAETIRTRLAGPLADEYAGYAVDIAEAGRHLLALVEDLADLDAVEAPEFSPAPDPIDMADCARRAAGILAMRAAERGIALVTPPDDHCVPATGEFRRVLQILLNLLTNAIRYGPEHSTVRIDAGGDADTAWIAVSDEGEGLGHDQATRVFDKFERLGRTGDGGSGLGLYISRRLARAMGGDLVVSGLGNVDGESRGARFVLSLPGRTAA